MLRRLFTTLLLTLYSAAAFAAEAAHGTEGKEQLPQFNLASFPSQTFWLFVTFTVVYVCVKTMIMPQVGGTMEKRDAHIKDSLQTAGVLNEKARLLQNDYETRMTQARQESLARIQLAKDSVARELANGEAQQREVFNVQRSAFMTRFEAGKADLLKTLTKEAEILAATTADKILSSDNAKKKKAA